MAEIFGKGDREERRASPRQEVREPATLAFGDTQVKCEVRDLSEGGARLKCDAPHEWPERLTITIGDRAPRECQVVWSLNTLLGVKFTDGG